MTGSGFDGIYTAETTEEYRNPRHVPQHGALAGHGYAGPSHG